MKLDRATAESLFQNVANNGAELVSGFVPVELASHLLKEVEMLHFTEPTAPQCFRVQQEFEKVAFRSIPADMPALDALDELVQDQVHLANYKFGVLDSWVPNEISVQRYTATGHITSHKDLKRHRLVVAIVNLVGSCGFDLLTDREGQVIRTFTTKPGDLILLRAPGLVTSSVDDRPFHKVSGNRDFNAPYRISISFRYNSDPDKPLPGFTFEN